MDLSARVRSSFRWTLTARALGQLGTWAVTLYVMRVLSPTDYGLNAMAGVCIGFVQVVDSLGLGAAMVREREPTERLLRQVMGVLVIVRIGLFIGFQLLAPLIGAFFDEPRVVPLLRVMAFLYLITIFETLPLVSLERAVTYKKISIAEMFGGACGTGVVLACASAGYGVWALVWGLLVQTAGRAIALNFIVRPMVLPMLRFDELGKHLRFGLFICSERLLGFAFQETDKVIGGHMLGATASGFYSVGSHIACLPVNKVMGLINSVTFSAFSSMQHGQRLNSRHLEQAVSMLSVSAFPVFFGLGSVAPELVPLVIGKQWLPSVPIIQILAVVMPLRMIANILQPILWSAGAPRVSLANLAVASAGMAIALAIGSRFGVIGLAMGWLLAYPPLFLWTVWRSCRHLGFSVRAVLGPVSMPLLASLLMAGIVMATRTLLSAELAHAVALAILTMTGAVALASIMWMLARSPIREAVQFIRG